MLGMSQRDLGQWVILALDLVREIDAMIDLVRRLEGLLFRLRQRLFEEVLDGMFVDNISVRQGWI